jgi:hypothetical protein
VNTIRHATFDYPSLIVAFPVSAQDGSNLSRRQLLAGGGTGAAAHFFNQSGMCGQVTSSSAVVFTHTSIVAIGPTDPITNTYPHAQVGRRIGLRCRHPVLLRCQADRAGDDN